MPKLFAAGLLGIVALVAAALFAIVAADRRTGPAERPQAAAQVAEPPREVALPPLQPLPPIPSIPQAGPALPTSPVPAPANAVAVPEPDPEPEAAAEETQEPSKGVRKQTLRRKDALRRMGKARLPGSE